ncbi:hypothetical protein GR255_27670, partial [Mycobacterium tuberculosis]|nr:hypothetical protein [Mycobacterium tuberculosis]
TLPRVQAALAHECNHNVRFQFVKWNQQTTLADWVVSEGLAESFAAELYGKDLIGPWVTSTSPEQLEEIKPIISSQLHTLPRVQAALAHECNHNVRFQFVKWNQQTTLAD